MVEHKDIRDLNGKQVKMTSPQQANDDMSSVRIDDHSLSQREIQSRIGTSSIVGSKEDMSSHERNVWDDNRNEPDEMASIASEGSRSEHTLIASDDKIGKSAPVRMEVRSPLDKTNANAHHDDENSSQSTYLFDKDFSGSNGYVPHPNV